MDASELLKRYAAGEREFSEIDLSETDLAGVNLNGANLYQAKLNRANLYQAKLMETDLREAELNHACLVKANLSNASISFAYINGANLSEANLIETDLAYACLIQADLSEANLSKANLSYTDLIKANLTRANLSGADLNHADLCEGDLTNAELTDANLIGTKFTSTNLSGAKLEGTILGYQKILEELEEKNQGLIERVKLLEAQLAQRKQVQDLIKVTNQGTNAPYEWNGFYFRSKTEIKIAKALDSTGILFYPNSKARLNKAEVRINRESDFLVFQAGKFGILEVDGRPYHQTAADDHERDRLFKRYGIRVIERFDATRCWNEPDKVIQEFLEILNQA